AVSWLALPREGPMGNLLHLSARASPDEEAAEWLARLDRGLSPDEQTRLRDWLRADRRNPEALVALAALWDDLDVLAELSALLPLERAAARPAPRGGPTRTCSPGARRCVRSSARRHGPRLAAVGGGRGRRPARDCGRVGPLRVRPRTGRRGRRAAADRRADGRNRDRRTKGRAP